MAKMTTKQAVENFDVAKGVHGVYCYGISAEELHVKIAVALSEHISHMDRADLAERFLEMCDTCGIEQALLSLIDAWGRGQADFAVDKLLRLRGMNSDLLAVVERLVAYVARAGTASLESSIEWADARSLLARVREEAVKS